MPIYAHIQEILGAFIVIVPLILFFIIVIYFKNKIANDEIKLVDLLAEPDYEAQKEQAERQKKKDGESGDVKMEPKRSASRFILFVTGITTLVITVCFTTYYFYIKIYAINGGADPDLEGFTNVLLALGIGVVPYTVNQVKKIKL